MFFNTVSLRGEHDMLVEFPQFIENSKSKTIFLHFNMRTGCVAIVRAMLLRIYTPIPFRIILSISHWEVLT